jgi:hypothetical protein
VGDGGEGGLAVALPRVGIDIRVATEGKDEPRSTSVRKLLGPPFALRPSPGYERLLVEENVPSRRGARGSRRCSFH